MFIKKIFTFIRKKFHDEINQSLSGSIESSKNMSIHSAYTNYNIKNIMGMLAQERIAQVMQDSIPDAPSRCGITSKLSTQADLESQWCRYWLKQLKLPYSFIRKNWELAFVLQVLYEHDMLDKKGLGLACGNEALPSYLLSRGARITAGDKPHDGSVVQNSWSSTNQYTNSKESLFYGSLVDRETFETNFTLSYVDMNALPSNLNECFDFCWSVCAIEHLGSIQNGLDFIKNSVRLLKPGGISVHTTEFNLFSEEHTIDNCGSVLFQKKHFKQLQDELFKLNAELYPFDFTIGDGRFDTYIDTPPYPHQPIEGIEACLDAPAYCPHIKLLVDGFPATCAGIVIKKKIETAN